MFYCDPCRVECDWPTSIRQSYGKCEICQKTSPCYDMSSKYLPSLPKPQKKIKERWSSHDIALLSAQIAELVKEYDLETEFEPTDLAVDFVFSLLQFNDREHYDTDAMGN